MKSNAEPLRLQFDLFELDERQARLTRGGKPLALPPKAFAVLCTLARRADQLVSKEDLLDGVWGHQYVSDSVLKTTISELRAALGDDARQPRYIETAARRGYRFIADMQARPAMAPTREHASDVTLAPLIGRAAALDWLRTAWRDAQAGRRQIVWLAGEAGIGKSSLIDHFSGEVGADCTALGQCVEQHGAGEPYLPVLEALGARCRSDPTLAPLLRSVAPTWLLQLPWLSNPGELDGLRQLLVGTGQQRMLRELGELLDQYTAQRPLLLVTEDLHWSDAATLRAIDHVARRRGPARLLWLASLRAAEVIAQEDHPLRSLRHELKLHRLARELHLDPFSERDVADCIARRWPGLAVPDALARRLHRRTDGLPLFVISVIDDLLAQGRTPAALDRGADDDALASPPVPESLAGVIERQIDRLTRPQRDLLQAASVCGLEFSASTVAAALQCADVGSVVERCDELAAARQWLNPLALRPLPDGSIDADYAFRHALYRQVFYQRLGAPTRAQWHGRVAAALQRRHTVGDGTVTAAELALQFELGHDATSAIGHYARAAENALRHFAPDEAMRLSAHAVTLLPRCPEGTTRDALEWALLGPRVAASQLLSVTTPEARDAFERVRALHASQAGSDDSSGLDIELGWVHFTAGESGQALLIASQVRDGTDEQNQRVRHVAACNLRGTVLSYRGRLSEGRHQLEQGLAAAEGLGDRIANARAVVDLEVSLRCRLAQTLSHLGDVDAARSQIDAALARATRHGPYTRRLTLIFAALLALRLGDAPTVLALAGQLQRLADEHAMVQAEGPARWLRGWALAQGGEPATGHDLILDGDARDHQLGLERGRSGVLGHAAQALILARRWPEAQAQLDRALALSDKMEERIYLPDLHLLQARIQAGLGLIVPARQAIRRAWREAAQQQAAWQELSALVALVETGSAQPDDFAALAGVRARLRGGDTSMFVARADALLTENPRPAAPQA